MIIAFGGSYLYAKHKRIAEYTVVKGLNTFTAAFLVFGDAILSLPNILCSPWGCHSPNQTARLNSRGHACARKHSSETDLKGPSRGNA